MSVIPLPSVFLQGEETEETGDALKDGQPGLHSGSLPGDCLQQGGGRTPKPEAVL